MKKYFMVVGIFVKLFTVQAQKADFTHYPVYNGNDLGLTYSPKQSSFRIWAPTADEVMLSFYQEGIGGEARKVIDMKKAAAGTWTALLPGDQKGLFYTFKARINGKWHMEVPDPYAKAAGVNGKRALVIDLTSTNPEGWHQDQPPVLNRKTDAIIYELHVRDASISPNSGIRHKGKFLGLAESGTKNQEGLSTGLDHIKELGITHVHLLPFYDINSVDETKTDKPQYNWGYDPLNYNIPEGSYATNAMDGITRIKELKQLVKTFHENGLRVVMDVVYNHTALTETSHFNQLVPGYYYRQTKDGKFSNATACGNETASERPMMRKFILESMKYWVQEYHIDGFRVDLMGVHDIETMNLVSKELHRLRPDILLYGEGWTAGASPLPDSLRALKKNASKLDRIAVFSDDIRDGIKGSVFEHEDRGFASGKAGMEESVKFGIVASCKHPQVNYKKVNYSKAPYAAQPYQTVTYAECHDNHVLWDKLAISAKDASDEDRVNMHKLSLSIVLTSQGIAFLHAGTEFLRTKMGVENSFESPDSINQVDWQLKSRNKQVVDYVKSLVQLRKKHPAFRMNSAAAIAKNIRFMNNVPPGIIAYTIDAKAAGDSANKIMVIFNGSSHLQTLNLPAGSWKTLLSSHQDSEVMSRNRSSQGTCVIPKYSSLILYR
ncbi:MAG TPA: type I pullulanase [Chitinophagaceae bacterium]|nr:type I pullulanase [Chitinophagaceae bacterium]